MQSESLSETDCVNAESVLSDDILSLDFNLMVLKVSIESVCQYQINI